MPLPSGQSRAATAFPTSGAVLEGYPLAPLTTWGVGGAARWFWEPSAAELPAMLGHCRERGIPTYFLGRGSNVLVSDAGLDGLVVCTRRALLDVRREGDTLVAGAGVPLPALARTAAGLGRAGLEFLAGIPGTVGGGVVINAGLGAGGALEIGPHLIEVEVVDATGADRTLPAHALDLAHRRSALLGTGAFVARARFRLGPEEPPGEIRRRMARHLADRRQKQPLQRATAGSTFRRPEGGEPAAWYIDRCGLKGHRIGGARVSPKHAGWIENVGGARAADVAALIEHVRAEVLRGFGVDLQPEVQRLPEDAAAPRPPWGHG